ncbi:MAG: DUF4258 domain-containing protein [archaeon]|nr:DUF4258 domain-containing protein [archaeon]
MRIKITKHAMERMEKYGLTEEQIKNCLKKPDLVVEGQEGRKIAQKRLNGYVGLVENLYKFEPGCR